MKRLKSFFSQRSNTADQSADRLSSSSGAPARFGLSAVLASFLAAILLVPLTASAADTISIADVFSGSGLPQVSLAVFIVFLIKIFLAFLGILAIAFLMYGGYVWMTSGGDSGKVDKAKAIIKNAIIGLVIIFSSYAIASFVMSWLSGTTGTGTSTGNAIGGNGDWSRSAIGAGPIQSVYPKPNQTNVPINTRIAVTFKEDIDPATICDLSGGGSSCSGNAMKNITICEISSSDDSAACLADSEFSAEAFSGSTVTQASSSDFKTFVIAAAKYLGNDDGTNRTFKVVLGNGIEATATGKSIFSGFRYDSYTWAFKTNGILDLDPPQIAELGIYPNPDTAADTYDLTSEATAGVLTLTLTNNPTSNLESPMYLYDFANSKNIAYAGGALSDFSVHLAAGSVASAFKLYLKSDSGFKASSDTTVEDMIFTIEGNQARFTNYAQNAADFGITFDACSNSPKVKACLTVADKMKIDTKAGFYFETNGGDLPQGSQWQLRVTGAKTGSSFTIYNGSEATNYIFAQSGLATKITKTAAAATGSGTVSTDYYTIVVGSDVTATRNNLISAINSHSGSIVTASAGAAGNVATIMPKTAGANSLSLALNSGAEGVLSASGSLSGEEQPAKRTIAPTGTAGDAYNNSVFRITFDKAINPINLGQYLKVIINGEAVTASTTFSNNYRTVELTGTVQCGTNNCGQPIYCWMEPANAKAYSVPASVEIVAASLKTCLGADSSASGNEWCRSFGGSCTTNGRCVSGGLYYPQASTTVDGLTDMSNNSFNGSFDQVANAKGTLVGNAQGQSGSGDGHSGTGYYNANKHLTDNVFNYEASSSFGDNFFWSFFLSSQVDLTAPILTKVLPIGDYSLGSLNGETFRDPVKFVFNTLMRAATIQPGWGYGTSTSDSAWYIRYLVLKTITSGANPVGYWASFADGDSLTSQGIGDGTADYSIVNLEHNPFDQSVSYGPLAGSGLQSITQNCYIPGNGPISAGATDENNCRYNSDGSTSGCVTDLSIAATSRVTSTNPSSYGYLNCVQIDGAVTCNSGASDNGDLCKIHTATSTVSANGSWILTKDYATALTADNTAYNGKTQGRTGCCFGKCLNQ